MPTPIGWSATTRALLGSRADANSLIDGQRWASTSVSYSFAGLGATWSTGTNGYGPRTDTTSEPWSPGYGVLSADNRAAVRTALDAWANVSNLRFNEVTETASAVGDLRFAFSNLGDAQAWAYSPGDAPIAGDVWFDTQGSSRTRAWTPGSYEFHTAVHEIGHALGLKHPFEAGNDNTLLIPAAQDTRSLTVMSYSAQAGRTGSWFSYEPTTPMLLDVAAIQALYGVNRQYRPGNDAYTFSGTATYHQTIWDGGGTDTLRYESTSGGLLDLREGQASRLGQSVDIYGPSGVLQRGVKNVWIAYGTVIENATGGSGADEIMGNDVANLLLGGAGNDSMQGGAGNDTLDGGAGNDVLTGGSGNDTYVVDSAADKVTETAATATEIDTVQSSVTWTLGANLEWLTLSGSAALNGSGNALANRITGNGGANVLSGAAGNDTLDGGAGADSLLGGADNDTLLGGAGLDTLDGGAGNDSLNGGADADAASYASATAAVTVSLLLATAQNTGGAGTDTLTAIESLTGSAFNDKLTGNTGANLLQGGAGNDALLGDVGNDTLQGDAGNDTLAGGAGLDVLTGGAGADVFDFNALADSGATATTCDLVNDFSAAQGDRIDLRDIDANPLPSQAGVQHFTGLIALNIAFSRPGQLHFDAATGLLTANTDTDRDAEFALKLTGVNSLAATSLWLA